MKTPKPIKGFDALAFKHASALKIYRKIKGMTPQEELAFWKQAKPVRPPSIRSKRQLAIA